MRGQGNHHYLQNEKMYAGGILEGYQLCEVKNAGFPAIKAAEGKSTVGEIYEIDEELEKMIDRLEGIPYLYTKKEVEVRVGTEGKVTAIVYVAEENNTVWSRLRPYGRDINRWKDDNVYEDIETAQEQFEKDFFDDEDPFEDDNEDYDEDYDYDDEEYIEEETSEYDPNYDPVEDYVRGCTDEF